MSASSSGSPGGPACGPHRLPTHAFAFRSAFALASILLAVAAWSPGFARGQPADSACALTGMRPVLPGDSLDLEVLCPSAGDCVYAWDLGEGGPVRMAGSRLRHAYAGPGQYTLLVRVTDTVTQASEYLTARQPVRYPATAGRPAHAAPILLDPQRRRVWVANAGNHSVSVLDAAAGQDVALLKEIPVGRNPRTVALDGQGRIWVVNQDDATLTWVDGASLEVLRTLALPRASRPYGVAVDRAGGRAYVTLQGADRAAARAGRGLRFRNGRVTHLPGTAGPGGVRGRETHPGDPVRLPRRPGAILEVDGGRFAEAGTVSLDPDPGPDTQAGGRGIPNLLNAVVISPDGRRAWVPAIKSNTARGLFLSGELSSHANIVRAMVSRVDLAPAAGAAGPAPAAGAAGTVARESPADRTDLDNRSQPSAVAFTADGRIAYVATRGSNTVEALAGWGWPHKITSIEPRRMEDELAPEGLVLDGRDSLLFVAYANSRQVGVYDVSGVGESNLTPRLALVRTVVAEKLAPDVLRGLQVFYNAADTRMSGRAISPARSAIWTADRTGGSGTSPIAGRACGAPPPCWAAPGWAWGRCIGAPTSTRSRTSSMICAAPSGARASWPTRSSSGTRNRTLGDRKAGHLRRTWMPWPPMSPPWPGSRPAPSATSDGSLTAAGKRGEALFQRADVGCARCHAAPLFTDSRLPSAPGSAGAGPMAGDGPAGPAGQLERGISARRRVSCSMTWAP